MFARTSFRGLSALSSQVRYVIRSTYDCSLRLLVEGCKSGHRLVAAVLSIDCTAIVIAVRATSRGH
eukprot:2821347-Amphidinium_carterae.1